MSAHLIKKIKLPIGIVGLGISGRATRELLHAAGAAASDIFTFDAKSPDADFHDYEKFLQSSPKTLVVSPGVPLTTPWLVRAVNAGADLSSELSLAFSMLKDEQTIAVTGSLGKSTVVSLVGEALRALDKNVFVGGNLGVPLSHYMSEVLRGSRDRADWLALELSSYQLENFDNLKAQHAIITYFAPNHLDRYVDKDAYYQTKWSLVRKTSGVVIANRSSSDLVDFAKSQTANSIIWTSQHDPLLSPVDFSKAQLVGSHNRDNLAMVAKLALESHLPAASLVGLYGFKGLPHRLENLGQYHGATWINDSKATTIESVLSAVVSATENLDKTARVIVLVGGRDKNLPWAKLGSLGGHPQLRFAFFGECGRLAQSLSKLPGGLFSSLGQAISFAKNESRSGDVVLLSPGGSSLDEFRSFEERGDFFRNEILKR